MVQLTSVPLLYSLSSSGQWQTLAYYLAAMEVGNSDRPSRSPPLPSARNAVPLKFDFLVVTGENDCKPSGHSDPNSLDFNTSSVGCLVLE